MPLLQQFLNLRASQEGWRCRWGSCRISNHHTVSDFSKGGGNPQKPLGIFLVKLFLNPLLKKIWMKSGKISIWPLDSLLLSVYHIVWYLESWGRARLDWRCKFVDTNTVPFWAGNFLGWFCPRQVWWRHLRFHKWTDQTNPKTSRMYYIHQCWHVVETVFKKSITIVHPYTTCIWFPSLFRNSNLFLAGCPFGV